MAGTRKTLYQKLLTAKQNDCKGKTGAAAALTAAANAYKTDAIAKGKTATEAAATIKRVRESGCAISGLFSKKRRTVRKTTATRRKRA